ncbi:hypothetical protein SETIT_8G080100v2 [Setaria italica]|uniref:Uncharacterized protein n=1 Tax=Setaria italica TaxID=4555 RepID=A0A368S5M4_SETIT|nr:hypothetical protein SETIT_8G080100v2 [Setaria italica]
MYKEVTKLTASKRRGAGGGIKSYRLLIQLSKESFTVVFFSEIQFPLSHRPNTIIKDNTVAMTPNALASNDDISPKIVLSKLTRA